METPLADWAAETAQLVQFQSARWLNRWLKMHGLALTELREPEGPARTVEGTFVEAYPVDGEVKLEFLGGPARTLNTLSRQQAGVLAEQLDSSILKAGSQ